jgi:PucR family transcriptional regulator, purine catabolism regulatory protein
MATVEALRAAILPGARWVANGPEESGSTARTRDLAWVRLMRARVPAFDALERGDVAIVPLAAAEVVAPDPDGIAALVGAAAAAEIAGIVVVADALAPASSTAGTMVARLVAAADQAGVPVLDAGTGDAAAIERSAIGFLVNHRAELDRQATILETRLEAVALAGGGPAGLAAAIAGFLGRAVAIEGRRGLPIAVHAPADVPASAASVAAYHERPRSVGIRIALPPPGPAATADAAIRAVAPPDAAIGNLAAATAGPLAEPAGALVLLGDRPSTELDRIATARIAGLLALELARDEAVGRAVDSARREALPSDGPPWVVIVARQGGPDEPFDPARRESVRRDLRALGPARRLTLRGDVQSVEVRVVAAAVDDDPDGVGLTRRVSALLGRTAAVSRPFRDAAGRSAAEAEARATLEAAERLVSAPSVARAERLPAYRLLGSLHNLPDGERQARALLEPLLVGRPDVVRERLATLRTLLEQPGLSETAAALGVHRNTVAYRIRRIESLTGWHLADPELRFPLALALKLVHDD